ncbi:hypothetical protein CEXT_555671 [Caerostris extrusa]|uniref:Uncharacterized protein n=1 Tax=Caerostris extrusa TaxID=172846 RepID=A0AAV4MF62_CAEEX|nr:hypothetical protein CEXT_555671 [Caerostris extrusa]
MIDSVYEALRHESRFAHELFVGHPDEEARLEILQKLCRKIKLSSDFYFYWLAHHTPGYAVADLKKLVVTAKKRLEYSGNTIYLQMELNLK